MHRYSSTDDEIWSKLWQNIRGHTVFVIPSHGAEIHAWVIFWGRDFRRKVVRGAKCLL